jgi:prefoldin subunit 5
MAAVTRTVRTRKRHSEAILTVQARHQDIYRMLEQARRELRESYQELRRLQEELRD